MNFSRKYLHRVCFLYVNLSTSPSDHFRSYSSVHITKALFSFLILCFFLCWVFMLLLLLLLDDSARTVSLRQCAAPKASAEVILHRLRKQEYKVIGLTNTHTHTPWLDFFTSDGFLSALLNRVLILFSTD